MIELDINCPTKLVNGKIVNDLDSCNDQLSKIYPIVESILHTKGKHLIRQIGDDGETIHNKAWELSMIKKELRIDKQWHVWNHGETQKEVIDRVNTK